MRIQSVSIVINLFALLWPTNVGAQWTETSNPSILVPISTHTVSARGDTILVGTYQNTIFRSTNRGVTWAKADSGLSPSLYWTFSFLFDGATVYAGTYDGVYRSTNMGEGWTLANNGIPITWASGVYCFLKKGDSLLAGTEYGVYLTTDAGGSWQPDTVGLPVITGADPIHSLISRNNIIFAGTNDGVYRSTDGDGHWQPMNAGIPINWGNYHAGVEEILATSECIHIVTGGWGMYRSIDDGNTWVAENAGFHKQDNGFFFPMTSAIELSGLLYVGTQSDGVYASTNGGDTWANVSLGLPPNSYILSFAKGDSVLLAAADEGLFQKMTDSPKWAALLTEFPGKVDYRTIAISGSNMIVEASSDYIRNSVDGIYLSSDAGNSWTQDTSLKMTNVSFQTIGDYLYAMGQSLLVSSDQGIQWTQMDSGLLRPINAIARKSTKLFAATGRACPMCVPPGPNEYGGVYVSTDNGASWSSAGLVDTTVLTIVVEGNNLFAGGLRGVYRSTDEGQTWTVTDHGLPALHQEGIQLVALDTTLFVSNHGGVYRSTDNGEDWAAVNDGLHFDTSGIGSSPSLLTHGNLIFAGTGNGIYLSSNYGSTWKSLNSGLSGNAVQIRSLAISSTDLYVATGNGLWHRTLSKIVAVNQNQSGSSPNSFYLGQNYPNPFNPSTSIRYALPHRSHVTLSVFNALGQQVAFLVNGDQEAGDHEVRFDGSGLASGMYLYRIQAGTFVQTKKLLLLR